MDTLLDFFDWGAFITGLIGGILGLIEVYKTERKTHPIALAWMGSSPWTIKFLNRITNGHAIGGIGVVIIIVGTILDMADKIISYIAKK